MESPVQIMNAHGKLMGGVQLMNMLLAMIYLVITTFSMFITPTCYSDVISTERELDAYAIISLCKEASKDKLLSTSNTAGFHCKISTIFAVTPIEQSVVVDIFYKSPKGLHIEYIYEVANRGFLIVGYYNEQVIMFNPKELRYNLYNVNELPIFITKATKHGLTINTEYSTEQAGSIDIDIASILEIFIDSQKISISEKLIDGTKLNIIDAVARGETRWVAGKMQIMADTLLPHQIWLEIEGKNSRIALLGIIYNYGGWSDSLFYAPIETINELFTVNETVNAFSSDWINEDYLGQCIDAFNKINVLDYVDNGDGRVKPILAGEME